MDWPTWGPALSMVAVATAVDLRKRRIPNWLTLPCLAAGLASGAWRGGLDGLGKSADGAGLAILLLVLPCGLKMLGWGDLKLCAALGAWIGPGALMLAILVTAMAGGVMAAGYLLLRGSGDTSLGRPAEGASGRLTLDHPTALKLPYAPAIAIGTLFAFLAQ
jgi:prepilin peptidase CpaA